MVKKIVNVELEVEQSHLGTTIQVFDLINAVSKGLEQYQRTFVKNLNITPTQYSILNIMEKEKIYSPSFLADARKCTRPTITGILDTLEKKNLVKRELNPNDRRKFSVSLTDEGAQLKRSFPDIGQMFRTCCMDINQEEMNQLIFLLQKLERSLNSSCLHDERSLNN
ncbi:MAG: MarR family winged helix-turn-helix transcriptional regulator [Candidatus Hodarchaeales archaeon]